MLACVVAFGFNEDLVSCIESIINQNRPADIIVINNKVGLDFMPDFLAWVNSRVDEDFVVDWIENDGDQAEFSVDVAGANFKMVAQQSIYNYGFAYGCNKALKKLLEDDIDYCWLLNPDAVADVGALKELLAVSKKLDDNCIVGSKVIARKSGNKGFNGLGYIDSNYRTISKRPSASVVSFAHGASMLIPGNVVEKVGFMNENFFLYWEEVYYCYKARELSVEIACAEKSLVVHEFGGAIGDGSPLQIYFSTRNLFIFIRLTSATRVVAFWHIFLGFSSKSIKAVSKFRFNLLWLYVLALVRALKINKEIFVRSACAVENKGEYVSDKY